MKRRVRRQQMSLIAIDQHFVNCLEGDGARQMGTQLMLESELGFLCETVLQQ